MIRYLEDLQIPTNRSDMQSYLFINSASMSQEAIADFHVCRPKGRKDYHILYIEQGDASIHVNNEWFPLKAGQACLFPPNEAQEYIKTKGTRSLWTHFTGFGAEQLCNALGLQPFRSIQIADQKNFCDLFTSLIVCFAAKQAFYEVESTAFLIQILTKIGQSTSALPQPHSLINTVVAQMQKDIHLKFDMEKYANLCCLSVSRFSYVFSKNTGSSPYRFFTELKIRQACYLLKNTDKKIKTIAFELGYDDELHFSVIFKKLVGLSPKFYRAKS